ncbi:MAG: lipopolysaccharide transport periplasmic protein LptA [Pseudomonadota bacterium]
MTVRQLGAIFAAGLSVLVAGGVAAAQENSPFGGFKHDSSEPIEITSDSLEVRQSEQRAIFAGAVEAGQGTLRLNADRVIVAYDQQEQNNETGAIRNMKAEGNVFLTNGAETATGRFAEYDVITGMMFMRGEVILTQGTNVVSGELLEINLNTGRAQMKGGVTTTGTGGRVKSIFTPSANTGSN